MRVCIGSHNPSLSLSVQSSSLKPAASHQAVRTPGATLTRTTAMNKVWVLAAERLNHMETKENKTGFKPCMTGLCQWAVLCWLVTMVVSSSIYIMNSLTLLWMLIHTFLKCSQQFLFSKCTETEDYLAWLSYIWVKKLNMHISLMFELKEKFL